MYLYTSNLLFLYSVCIFFIVPTVHFSSVSSSAALPAAHVRASGFLELPRYFTSQTIPRRGFLYFLVAPFSSHLLRSFSLFLFLLSSIFSLYYSFSSFTRLFRPHCLCCRAFPPSNSHLSRFLRLSVSTSSNSKFQSLLSYPSL